MSSCFETLGWGLAPQHDESFCSPPHGVILRRRASAVSKDALAPKQVAR
jgi:hypothetical protein